MVELSTKVWSGILVLVIALASGVTYYLEDTGDYTNCRAEWNLEETGQYTCPKNNRTEWCYNIESRGSGWYRCYIGKVVYQQPLAGDSYSIGCPAEKILRIRADGKIYECPTETITTCIDVNCRFETNIVEYLNEFDKLESYNETTKVCDEECTSEDGFINQWTRCSGGSYLGEKLR